MSIRSDELGGRDARDLLDRVGQLTRSDLDRAFSAYVAAAKKGASLTGSRMFSAQAKIDRIATRALRDQVKAAVDPAVTAAMGLGSSRSGLLGWLTRWRVRRKAIPIRYAVLATALRDHLTQDEVDLMTLPWRSIAGPGAPTTHQG